MLDAGGFIFATQDLAFRTGLHSRAIPEPGTLALLGLGLACLGFSPRRKVLIDTFNAATEPAAASAERMAPALIA
jgi:hypothetical protein